MPTVGTAYPELDAAYLDLRPVRCDLQDIVTALSYRMKGRSGNQRKE